MSASPRRVSGTIVGWTLVLVGICLLAWLALAAVTTRAANQAAQQGLLEQFERSRARAEVPTLGATEAPSPAEAGSDGPVALLRFVRPPGQALLRDEPLAVVAGVTLDDLARGPGHYPGTAAPGAPGNFAVAGHRTTHGAPFGRIDELREGDEVHVTDAAGAVFVYRVVDRRIVTPEATWVITSDPLGTGAPTLTLTTCHPRFSDAQRLVVFAELVSP